MSLLEYSGNVRICFIAPQVEPQRGNRLSLHYLDIKLIGYSKKTWSIFDTPRQPA